MISRLGMLSVLLLTTLLLAQTTTATFAVTLPVTMQFSVNATAASKLNEDKTLNALNMDLTLKVFNALQVAGHEPEGALDTMTVAGTVVSFSGAIGCNTTAACEAAKSELDSNIGTTCTKSSSDCLFPMFLAQNAATNATPDVGIVLNLTTVTYGTMVENAQAKVEVHVTATIEGTAGVLQRIVNSLTFKTEFTTALMLDFQNTTGVSGAQGFALTYPGPNANTNTVSFSFYVVSIGQSLANATARKYEEIPLNSSMFVSAQEKYISYNGNGTLKLRAISTEFKYPAPPVVYPVYVAAVMKGTTSVWTANLLSNATQRLGLQTAFITDILEAINASETTPTNQTDLTIVSTTQYVGFALVSLNVTINMSTPEAAILATIAINNLQLSVYNGITNTTHTAEWMTYSQGIWESSKGSVTDASDLTLDSLHAMTEAEGPATMAPMTDAPVNITNTSAPATAAPGGDYIFKVEATVSMSGLESVFNTIMLDHNAEIKTAHTNDIIAALEISSSQFTLSSMEVEGGMLVSAFTVGAISEDQAIGYKTKIEAFKGNTSWLVQTSALYADVATASELAANPLGVHDATAVVIDTTAQEPEESGTSVILIVIVVILVVLVIAIGIGCCVKAAKNKKGGSRSTGTSSGGNPKRGQQYAAGGNTEFSMGPVPPRPGQGDGDADGHVP